MKPKSGGFRLSGRGVCAALLAGALVILCSGPAEARMAKSLSYDFEYAVTGAGGGSAQSAGGDYTAVTMITAEGCASAPADSQSYSIVPVFGDETPADSPAAAGDWMLYY